MSKTITLRLSDKEYNLYSQAAKAAKRPISNLINYLAQKKLEENLFVDQTEMDEILGLGPIFAHLKGGTIKKEKVRDILSSI